MTVEVGVRFPSWLARVLALAAVVASVTAILVVGRGAQVPIPEVGEVAAQDYQATERMSVEDTEVTEARRVEAAKLVEPITRIDPAVGQAVRSQIESFFRIISQKQLHDQLRPQPEVAGPAPTVADPTASTLPVTTVPTPEITLPTPADIEAELIPRFAVIDPTHRRALIQLALDDLERVKNGEAVLLPQLEAETIALAVGLLEKGIADEVAARGELVTSPPILALPTEYPNRSLMEAAAADVVAQLLKANLVVDQPATDEAIQAAGAAVVPEIITYSPLEKIVGRGEKVSGVQAEAIKKLLAGVTTNPRPVPTLALVGAVTLLASVFLRRSRPLHWSNPKRVLLFGLLIVLAGTLARVSVSITAERDLVLGYLVPLGALGHLGGLLFDTRLALMLALPAATFTGQATGELGLAIFAGLATAAPLAFFSRTTSRRGLYLGAGYAAAATGVLAAGVAWFFEGGGQALAAGGYGLVGGGLAGLIGLGAIPYLDNLFEVTTSLTLLDLTDRNHPALRLLEEKAPGTYNHSIFVGTLASRAARSIGADALLAEAAAYYHDLGKTENPFMFIENQLGLNPHDSLVAEDSAQVVRDHVSDGLRLARSYRIPLEVAEGIRQHHGTSLMRFFYHQALDEGRPLEAERFRHTGVKPQRREMAILMLADSTEAAARSLAASEVPSPEGILKTVEQVIREKVDDGQLDESALTFGELGVVQRVLSEALVSHYHTRVVYPNFPSE